jgi:hypothetical protein
MNTLNTTSLDKLNAAAIASTILAGLYFVATNLLF